VSAWQLQEISLIANVFLWCLLLLLSWIISQFLHIIRWTWVVSTNWLGSGEHLSHRYMVHMNCKDHIHTRALKQNHYAFLYLLKIFIGLFLELCCVYLILSSVFGFSLFTFFLLVVLSCINHIFCEKNSKLTKSLSYHDKYVYRDFMNRTRDDEIFS
jgi:hypothetical protein